MKIKKVYDSWGELIGYKLGKFFLMKVATWGNCYEWIINDTGVNFYFHFEMSILLEDGKIELVKNCKAGKLRLIELNFMEGK